MKMLLTGCNGQVGWELARCLQPLGEVVALGRAELDLANAGAIAACVASQRPDVIVNAAAYTAVDKAESESELAFRINAEAPAALAQAAKACDALLVHYSTDYVFDGTLTIAHTEGDATAPCSVYGRSKLAGEQAVTASGCRHLILRTQWVFGSHGGNFLRTILRLAREREQLRIVSDQFGAPTAARLIADVTAQILGRQAGGLPVEDGVYHLAASGRTTWHEYASFVVERARACPALGQDLKVREIVPITTADDPVPAKRPANSMFDCGKLERAFGLRMPNWQRGVELCVAELAAR
jgi:dTDP-4-dehydrorhamnose reductase